MRALVCVALVLSLSACGRGGEAQSPSTKPAATDHYRTPVIALPDGRHVTCVQWSGYYRGGIDCDWANARP